MKLLMSAAVALTIMFGASVAQAVEIDCGAPTMPTVPASFETEEALKASYAEVKDYGARSEEYRECLMAQERMAGEDATPEFKKEITELHDGNIDDNEMIAAQFNVAYKLWKVAHPPE